jgi:hypothetical protein
MYNVPYRMGDLSLRYFGIVAIVAKEQTALGTYGISRYVPYREMYRVAYRGLRGSLRTSARISSMLYALVLTPNAGKA